MSSPGRAAAVTVLLGVCLVPGAWAQQPRPTVRLGVVAEESNDPGRMLRLFGGLLARLRQRLTPGGVDVGELVIARDLEDLSQRLARGEADLVIETVFPTLLLQQQSAGLSPALVVLRAGQREYRSVFFTRQGSPIRAVADLRGRTLVLQVPRSTSAFALPKVELERAGLSVGPASGPGTAPSDVRYVLALSELNQAAWVLHGRGDAGAFSNVNWETLPDRMRSQLRVFHETRPLVRGLLSFRTGLDGRVRARIESALLALAGDEPGRAALGAAGGITGFEPLTPDDRRELRSIAATLLRAGPRR